MAKSARASSVKSNNRALKEKVFGPVEAARLERLSTKLLELAAQPKPQRDIEMEGTTETERIEQEEKQDKAVDADAMDMDNAPRPKKDHRNGRIQKRKSKRALSVVFPKYGDKKKALRRKK